MEEEACFLDIIVEKNMRQFNYLLYEFKYCYFPLMCYSVVCGMLNLFIYALDILTWKRLLVGSIFGNNS